MQKIASQKHLDELNQRRLFFNVTRVRAGDRVAIAAMSIAILLGACGKPKTMLDQAERSISVTGAVAIVSSAAAAESHLGPVATNFAVPGFDAEIRSRSTTFVAALLETAFGKRAHADVSDCNANASTDTCSTDRTKTAVYEACAIGTSSLQFSGTVTLDYSNPSACSLTEVNQTVTRTAVLEHQAMYGHKIISTTKTSENYLGEDIGGGSRIKKTEKGYALRIIGQHMRRLDSENNAVIDVSIRSSVDMSMSDPKASTIVVDGGMLEVFNNQGKFTSRMVADQLYYDTNKCCYPMRGSFDITFVGQADDDSNKTGSDDSTGRITFGPNCGDVTLEQGDESVEIDVPACG